MAVCVLIQLILVQTGSVFGCSGASDAMRGAGLFVVFRFDELFVI